jgi:hypothetical protein
MRPGRHEAFSGRVTDSREPIQHGKTLFVQPFVNVVAPGGVQQVALQRVQLGKMRFKADRAQACQLGVYLHGLAGDLAVRELGQESLIASDIISYLPKAFVRIEH